MKKILVLLLALVAVGAMVFAEDAPPVATFGQYMDVTASYTSSALTYGVYNETYFNFNAKDMGFSATVVGGADLWAQPRNYAISYKVLPGMLTVKAGMLRETGGARFTSYIDGNGLSTRVANVSSGILFNVTPMDGLAIGVFQPFTGGTGSASDLGYENFVVQYSLPDLMQVNAGYRMQGATKELNVGANLKMVPDVTAAAGFRMTMPASGSSVPYIYITGGSSKLVAGVNLGLDADVVLASTMGYGLKILAEYGMDPYAFGLKLSYDNGSDQWYANNGAVVNPYVKMNFSKGDFIIGASYNTKTSTFTLPIDFELSY